MAEVDLSTTYLGLQLANPLVPSASPLSGDLDAVRRMEDAGAGAVVLPSLFEEQLNQQSHEPDALLARGTYRDWDDSAQSTEDLPFQRTLTAYLEHLRRAKTALGIPVIASLNGVSAGDWVRSAREIAQAGADALELSIYYVPTDPFLPAAEIEDEHLALVRAVLREVRIPVAVKLTPYFTNLAHLARRLDEAGADGLVLFNRFQQPDIDLSTLEVITRPSVSTPRQPDALRLPLTWVAILHGRVHASLAASGGVHCAADAAKVLLAGADVVMLASALLLRGSSRLKVIRADLERWMEAHGHPSVRQLKGRLSRQAVPVPAAFERAHYVRALADLPHVPVRAIEAGREAP